MEQPKRTREAGKLRDAIRYINAAKASLNTSSKTCATCFRRHDLNYTDAELARRLTRLARDLAKVATSLTIGEDLLVKQKPNEVQR